MENISNKTLATLLIASIVISLGGTLISLNKLSNQQVASATTGRAQQDLGTASITIQTSVSILLSTDTIAFGTGWINGSNPTCGTNGVNLSTEGSGTNDDDCFINASDSTAAMLATDFILNNDGTVNASVAIIGPNKTFLMSQTGAQHTKLNFTWQAVDDDSCLGTLVTGWTEFGASTTLCDDFNWTDADDDLTIEVNLRFPSDQASGTYSNSSIEFNAVQA